MTDVPTIERVTSPEAPEPAPELWSNCLVSNGIAYISGLTARGADFETIEGADEYAQAQLIFRKMDSLVTAAGGTMADVLKLTIFVTDIQNRKKIWDARREFFTGNFPCASLVEVRNLASPEILVEIEAVAHLGAGKPGDDAAPSA
ncbi:RidA family protein [Paenarthrobacter nicotinovorans]|uniref:RidA family protein n=1 Tax=Paenarthrobacter nicotinovorans TaxID=29320 RepID=UPI0038151AFC